MTESPNTPVAQGEQDVSRGGGARATNRRQLLTGLTSLPVIMTLPTNASAAAFGSALRCLSNQTDQPNDYFSLKPNGWRTEPVACIRVARPNGSDPTDLGDYGSGKFYDRSGRAWRMSGDAFVPVNSYSGPKYVVKSRTRAYTYVYVGEDGSYWGIDPAYRSRGGLAVYGSCYVSIMGAA